MNLVESLADSALAERLVQRYRPGAWIGGVHKAFGPVSEAEGPDEDDALEAHPAHYLAVLWKPPHLGVPFLPRWPFKVVLVAPDAAAAVGDLLDEIPMADRLWLTDQQIDWVLMARIVALTEPGLARYQREGLRRLLRNEDRATLAAIRLHYGDDDGVPQQLAAGR